MKLRGLFPLIFCFFLTGCQHMTSTDIGTVGGAVAGGALGHAIGGNTASTVGGAAVGAFIGNRVSQ